MRRALLVILGFAIGGVCLWLAARGVDWQEARSIFHAARTGDIVLGMALFGVDQFLRAMRWRALLAFRSSVPLGLTVQSLLVGFAVNSLLPARLGEFYRAHYLGQRAGLSGSGVFAAIVLERLLDLMAVICILALGLAIAGGGDGVSRQILLIAAALAASVVVTLAMLVALLSRHSAEDILGRALRLPLGGVLVRRGSDMVTNFAQALQCVRTRFFFDAILLTVPIWLVETAAVWAICGAVGVELGLVGMLWLAGGLALSVMVPTAPGYVGSYQMVFVLILAQFGVTATAAVVAATAVQLYLVGGFTLIGLAVMATAALLPRR